MKLIIASNYFIIDEPLKNLIQKDSDDRVAGLALWPDAKKAFIENKINYLTPLDLIKNEDHYKLADLVTDISNNWWKLCFPDKEEPEIDGLTISSLYPLEIEASFSPIIYNVLTIKRAVDHYQIDSLIFITKKNSNNKLSKKIIVNREGFTAYMANVSLSEIVKSTFESNFGINIVTYEQTLRISSNKLKSYNLRIRRILALVVMGYFHKIFLEFIEKLSIVKIPTAKGNIMILMGGRCLTGFIKNYKNPQRLSFLPYKFFVKKSVKLKPEFDYSFNIIQRPFMFEDINFTYLVKYIFDFTNYHLELLKKHYKALTEYIEKVQPKAYITIDVTKSLARLTMWGFTRLNIRTIWHGDGLTFSTNKLFKTFESYWWPSLPLERWIVSKYYTDIYQNSSISKGVMKISGYLDENFNGSNYLNNNHFSIIKKKILNKWFGATKNQKIILFAETINRPTFLRFISSESIFEILKSNEDVIEAFGNLDDYLIIFKLHPGSENYIHLFEEIIPKQKNLKIVTYIPISELIDFCDLVVVSDSDVGIEALFRQKNLLIYNYLNRPNVLSEIYNKMNHDPLKGPAARIAYNKEQLLEEAQELLKHSEHNRVSPGLEYLLKNASENFSFSESIEKLMI